MDRLVEGMSLIVFWIKLEVRICRVSTASLMRRSLLFRIDSFLFYPVDEGAQIEASDRISFISSLRPNSLATKGDR
jgi:hypothetical protein